MFTNIGEVIVCIVTSKNTLVSIIVHSYGLRVAGCDNNKRLKKKLNIIFIHSITIKYH